MNKIATGAPEGLVIIEDFLSGETIQSLRYYADGQIGITSRVEDALTDGRVAVKRDDGFSSDYISVVEIEDTVSEIFNRVFGEVVPKNFNTEMEWYEYPHILRYRKGGHYKQHADADIWDQATNGWKRNLDRDYSAIIYFNDEFEGGGLYFPILDYRVLPKPGMLVCFPACGKYAHAAEPVTTGNRYAIVSWGASIGSERVRGAPSNNEFYLNGQRA